MMLYQIGSLKNGLVSERFGVTNVVFLFNRVVNLLTSLTMSLELKSIPFRNNVIQLRP